MKTTLELINAIAPEHSRTTCSDDNKSNGYWFDDAISEDGENTIKGHARCTRCALFEIATLTITNVSDFNSF